MVMVMVLSQKQTYQAIFPSLPFTIISIATTKSKNSSTDLNKKVVTLLVVRLIMTKQLRLSLRG